MTNGQSSGGVLTLLMACASASDAMMKCVPLSMMAVVAFTPETTAAAAPLPMLIPVRLTDQYFCATDTSRQSLVSAMLQWSPLQLDFDHLLCCLSCN